MAPRNEVAVRVRGAVRLRARDGVAAHKPAPVGCGGADRALRRSDVGHRGRPAHTEHGLDLARERGDRGGHDGEIGVTYRLPHRPGVVHGTPLTGDLERLRVSVPAHDLVPGRTGGEPDGRPDQAGSDDRDAHRYPITRPMSEARARISSAKAAKSSAAICCAASESAWSGSG